MQQATKGWINGFIGMLLFSASLPATRVAVAEMNPWFLTCTRASVAGLLAVATVSWFKNKWPAPEQWISLVIVAVGVVLGFPLLTALALQFVSSAHSVVFIAALPLMTAIFAVLRAGEKPRPAFWVFSLLGCGFVMAYAFWNGGVILAPADLFMLFGVMICGFGYAEGGRLARHIGGWQVICWALILALPVMIVLALYHLPTNLGQISFRAWGGLAYVTFFSMFIGFIFWYRGLAQGGIAAVGQLQLLQPFFGLGISAFVLGEAVLPAMIGVSLAVVACVAGARRYAFASPAKP